MHLLKTSFLRVTLFWCFALVPLKTQSSCCFKYKTLGRCSVKIGIHQSRWLLVISSVAHCMKQARLYLSLILPSLLEDNPTRTFIFFSYFRYGYFIIPKAAKSVKFCSAACWLIKNAKYSFFFLFTGMSVVGLMDAWILIKQFPQWNNVLFCQNAI